MAARRLRRGARRRDAREGRRPDRRPCASSRRSSAASAERAAVPRMDTVVFGRPASSVSVAGLGLRRSTAGSASRTVRVLDDSVQSLFQLPPSIWCQLRRHRPQRTRTEEIVGRRPCAVDAIDVVDLDEILAAKPRRGHAARRRPDCATCGRRRRCEQLPARDCDRRATTCRRRSRSTRESRGARRRRRARPGAATRLPRRRATSRVPRRSPSASAPIPGHAMLQRGRRATTAEDFMIDALQIY